MEKIKDFIMSDKVYSVPFILFFLSYIPLYMINTHFDNFLVIIPWLILGGLFWGIEKAQH